MEKSENIKQVSNRAASFQEDASRLELEQLKGAEALKEKYVIGMVALKEKERALTDELAATTKAIQELMQKQTELNQHIRNIGTKKDGPTTPKKKSMAPRIGYKSKNKRRASLQ